MIDRTLEILSDLVAFPTVSSDSNLDLIAYAEDVLGPAGARLERVYDVTGEKASLWATFGPEGDGGLILSGHTDVVPVADQPWTRPPFELTAEGEKLFGRGTCDMKGFIACVLAMAPAFANPKRPIHIALTYDEEVSCFGAVDLARHLGERGLRPEMALIGEPTNMAVVDGHKGCAEYKAIVTGLEGHGSRPDIGVNAGLIAAKLAVRLEEIAARLASRPNDNGFTPQWTTLNVGKLSAGTVANVIPGAAELEWEMRPVADGDVEAILEELSAYAATLEPEMQSVAPETGIRIEEVGTFPPFLPVEPNPARDLMLSLTGENSAGLVSYCTEAGAFASLGLTAAICGPGSILQAHKPDEYIYRSELVRCLEVLEKLASKVSHAAS